MKRNNVLRKSNSLSWEILTIPKRIKYECRCNTREVKLSLHDKGEISRIEIEK